jgi:hypothetical protein
MRVAFAFVAFLLAASPALADEDRYATIDRQQAEAQRREDIAAFLDRVRWVSFAYVCKVLPQEPLTRIALVASVTTDARSTIRSTIIPQWLWQAMAEAKQKAMTQSAECDYWPAHPDEVHAVREQIRWALRTLF